MKAGECHKQRIATRKRMARKLATRSVEFEDAREVDWVGDDKGAEVVAFASVDF